MKLVVDKVTLEQVSLVIPCWSSFHHCSISICHCPLRCVIALTRQHIITSLAFKLGLPVWLSTWLVAVWGSKILRGCTKRIGPWLEICNSLRTLFNMVKTEQNVRGNNFVGCNMFTVFCSCSLFRRWGGSSDSHAHCCVCERHRSSHKAEVPLCNLSCAHVGHKEHSTPPAGECITRYLHVYMGDWCPTSMSSFNMLNICHMEENHPRDLLKFLFPFVWYFKMSFELLPQFSLLLCYFHFLPYCCVNSVICGVCSSVFISFMVRKVVSHSRQETHFWWCKSFLIKLQRNEMWGLTVK